MFWIKDSYASVWKVEDKGNYVDGSISTSEKKQDDTREYSNWNARFIGKCKDAAANLNERDFIKILSGKLTNVLYTNKNGEKKSYLRLVVMDFELVNNGQQNNNSAQDDQLPF